MSKINQIENAILELDGGAFQKLADSYLRRKGYEEINPIGSVVGNNKVRKGTPDTLIPTSDGKYIFAEYTTTLNNTVYSKFCKDIDKCFDEDKTGIPNTKIKEIVLCYTSQLSAEEIEFLREKCEAYNVNINLFGIGTISCDLLEKFPGVAKDHLGVEVDTGQIVPIDKFISLYESNKLTTTLNTSFHFREKEKNKLLKSLEDNSLVIVSGQPGVGKSRIAIECFECFIKNNESYNAYCIYNQGIDLFEDVKSYFSNSGEYLIFVDDANRVSGFQYILQLLQTRRSDQVFKIIVTVRDYALEQIRESCKPYELATEISLLPFTDVEIKGLVQDEFNINHHAYLNRIIEIAQGNARIAVMAARVAKDNDTLESIRDVSELYDMYFSSIRSDLEALKDKNILKVAGIVSFFRNVDQTNSDLMSDIERIFEISREDFWNTAHSLHDMEVFDMFENEVVKISDQVLATYLFYLVFFKEKILDFTILVDDLFPKFKQRLVDAVNPVINTFNIDETKKVMRLSVDKVWQHLKITDEASFIELIHVFWFLKESDTLVFIQEKINSLDIEILEVDDVKFEAGSNSSLPSFISTLSLFRFLGESEIKMSIELLMQYALKKPKEASGVMYKLIEDYGFEEHSHNYGYLVQKSVVDKLVELSDSGRNEYFSRIFVTLADNYLKTHFSNTVAGKGNTITITQFDLIETEELLELRGKILSGIFVCYENKSLQASILEMIFNYSQYGTYAKVSGVIKNDSRLMLVFVNELDNSKLKNCIIVNNYLNLLKRLKISYKDKIRKKFKSKVYEIYDVFSNRLERAELKLDDEQYKIYKSNKIRSLTGLYSKDNYSDLFTELFVILETLNGNGNGNGKWQVEQGILSIFDELAKRDPSLYVEVVEEYLNNNDSLSVDPWTVISNLKLSCGIVGTYNIISSAKCKSKSRWLFCYFHGLERKDIETKFLDELTALYSESAYEYSINGLDFLLNYELVEDGFVLKIIKVILDRIDDEPLFAHSLSLIFNKHTEINKQLFQLFSSELEIIESAYFLVDKLDHHSDYDGETFSKFIDHEPMFLNKYINDKFSIKNRLSTSDDSRDYSFLWKREDYIDVMSSVLDIIFDLEKKNLSYRYHDNFFMKDSKENNDEEIIVKQNDYLLSKIKDNATDREYMGFLFTVISSFKSGRMIVFYKIFLEENSSFDDFESLSFRPPFWVGGGSMVPYHQERVDFFNQLISLCDSVKYLKHRQYLERCVQDERELIKREKKNDFTEK